MTRPANGLSATAGSTEVMVSARTTGQELRRGAFLNAIAMLASNFRAIFTLLIARLLGPVALGLYSVAWAAADLISKLGVIGLDDAVTTFVARAEAVGDRYRSRIYFRVASLAALIQSTIVAAILSAGMGHIGTALSLEPQLTSALKLIVWCLPGIALYRVNTSVSRGVKVMQHDIYTRGLTEPGVTAIVFLIAVAAGAGIFAPELAAIVGSSVSGIAAWLLAASLFRGAPRSGNASSWQEAKALIRYAMPIGGDQFINAFIWRIDVIILGCFVGRAPGVTLTTLGIYGGVVGVANGLRRISQPFTPIFAPVVAGMTATGAQPEAAGTYARLLEWMLWILLPATAVMILAGDTIMRIYGPGFEQGGKWLIIAAIACATNAFVNLGETVIMVQRPALNLMNSAMTAVIGSMATFLLISRLGVMGAALGILVTYCVQGLIRTIILRAVFHWPNPWKNLRTVLGVAAVAIVPAAILRVAFPTIAGQIAAGLLCLAVFAAGWFYYRRAKPFVP
ncbi:MAG TPA: oligosaccharide flippase family protein [Chthoniobacterales bacterium]|nr:oligosaccharide flippase family protein [Chthoniobacterales bacterium]